MSGPSTHSMDIWIETNMSQIPFCGVLSAGDSQICANLFKEHTNTKPTSDFLSRIVCFKDVAVPAYYYSAAENLTSDLVFRKGMDGGLHFATGVCTCDPLWGLSGKDCTETPVGILLLVFLTTLAIWIIYLFGHFINLYKRGEFKSRRKKTLAIISIVLFVGQVVWLASTRTSINTHTHSWSQGLFYNSDLNVVLRMFGIGVVTLAIFLFFCGLLLDMTEFIRKDLQRRKGAAKKIIILKRLEIFFKFMPAFMLLVTFIFRENMAMYAMINIGAGLGVASAFIISIRVVDMQVRRLLPPNQVGAGTATDFQQAINATGNETAEHLKSASRRLRTMALRLQVFVLGVTFSGIVYTAVFSIKSAKLGILPTVFFGISQAIQSFTPFVGLNTFKITHIKIIVSKKKKLKQSKVKAVGVDKSSDCGTLGS